MFRVGYGKARPLELEEEAPHHRYHQHTPYLAMQEPTKLNE